MTCDGPERLRKWLKDRRMTAAEFAASCDLSKMTLSRYMQRRLVPSKVTALAFEFLTGGAVRHETWRPEKGRAA